jgi:hypothetical protein
VAKIKSEGNLRSISQQGKLFCKKNTVKFQSGKERKGGWGKSSGGQKWQIAGVAKLEEHFQNSKNETDRQPPPFPKGCTAI